MPAQDQILLQTKLHRPRLPHDLVVRTRLLDVLNQAIDQPLTLVCAPAGFGKTTLVSTWLDQLSADQPAAAASLPAAWLSLDENDSDLNLFLRYCIAAIRTIFREACAETLALLQAQRLPPQAVLNITLSNELEELPGEFIIVLDDYHTIQGVEVHNLLGELARHWPNPLHLVLISRISPPLPLDRLRAKRMVNEIRTRDLRFTQEEMAAYLSQSQFTLRDQNVLPLLEERFEGWPAGLHLAVLSLHSAGSQESVLRALSSENANITKYLVDEVLSHQLPEIQAFLLKTSILDRFCPSLCGAIIGEVDTVRNVPVYLDWIDRAELFVIPLDERREWYRYHHLFQELLQQRLYAEMAPDQVADFHRLASVWFAEHGLIDEALQHALAAGDLDLAAHQMFVGLKELLNREDRPTLERWLRMLPEEMIQLRPELLMVKAWSLQFQWRLDLQAKVLQQVEELLDTGAGRTLSEKDLQILQGQILLPRAQWAYFNNQNAQAIDLCRQILAFMPPDWTFVRGGAMIYLGLSMQANGQALAGERFLLDEYEAYGDKDDIYVLFVLQSLGFTYLQAGQLGRARQIAQVLVQRSARSGLRLMEYWGDWLHGVVCYERNELEAAAQYFTQILTNRYVAQISPYRDAVAGLALIHQIDGEGREAQQVLESISQFDLEQSGSETSRTQSLRARLLLMQGDLESAGRWADAFIGLPPNQALFWLEEPQETRAHILLARGTEADLRLALQILDTLDEIADKTHNTRYKIGILALRALALDVQGKTNQADGVLKQALDLAQPGDFIRVFVDLGERMQVLLSRLVEQSHSVEMIQRILAAFPEHEKDLAGSESPLQPAPRPSLSNSSLPEPLTRRELEVLDYLRGPLSIKEIAQKLNIASATAKGHTINIYAKLGVNRRWEAVSRAEELNIISPR
jgi:LuxR family transcriptional regulator, maltose regulon positive regulatory protein